MRLWRSCVLRCVTCAGTHATVVAPADSSACCHRRARRRLRSLTATSPLTHENRNASLMPRSTVGGNATLGAGSILESLASLPDGCAIPAGEVWEGSPARFVRRADVPTKRVSVNAGDDLHADT